MANDEVLVKVTADLSGLKEGFSNTEELWRKHNEDIKNGEKAIDNYVKVAVGERKKVDKAIQSNIDKVGAEGKAVQDLEKKFDSFSKKNEKSFDPKKVNEFNAAIGEISKNLVGFDAFDFSSEDLEELTSRLNDSKNEIEDVAIITEFLESKLKDIDSSGFADASANVKALQIELQEAQNYLKIVNETLNEYQAKPVDQKDASTFVELKEEQAKAKQAVNELTISLAEQEKEYQKSISTSSKLSTELSKIKDELVKLDLEGERGSARWVELSEKAKQYQEAVSRTNDEIRRSTSATEGLDQVIGAINGLVGLYSAAEGAAALFGNESEDLQKTLVRLNGAIALLNGLQAVQTELAKKETIAGRALTLVKGQYAIATDAGAAATTRLAAATKLLGIGLIVGALAAIVVYWEDIAKFIGLTSDRTERLNAIQQKSNEIAGDQIAKLKILVDRVKEGELSFKDKQEAVENYNKEFGNTLGGVSSYTELEKKLIEQGADYIKYLGLKAKAEAAYQLAIEKSKEALEKRSNTEVTLADRLRSVNPFDAAGNERSAEENRDVRNQQEADKAQEEADKILEIYKDLSKQQQDLQQDLGIVTSEVNADTIKEYEKLSSVLASLIDAQEDYRIKAIEDGREREKEVLRARLNDEKQKYEEQINDLKISEERKAKIRAEFNKLYNEETGVAYDQLRKDIAKIDEKYDQELNEAKLKAQQAIDQVYKSEAEIERKAIQDKFTTIREELIRQIEQTNDVATQNEIQVKINTLDNAESKTLETFDRKTNLDQLDREKQIAEQILAIQQANIAEIIKNEELKKFQLLNLERDYLNEVLNTYQDSFNNLEDQGLFDELVNTLTNSLDSQEILEAGNKLREAFGDEIASEVLKTVGALKEVGGEIEKINNADGFGNLIDQIGQWTSSLEGFAAKLAQTLGLQGKEADQFAQSIVVGVSSTLNSLATIFQSEINEYQGRVDAIQESINTVEDELERERQLYEDGYANNFEARKADLEDLKARKKEEEEELQKAQKRKAALQKAEFLIDTVSQLTNLITASTNIFKWASKIPIIGVPLAIGLITTMFGAFAVAKTKAFQAIGGGGQNFREGLREGKLSLKGPRHEEKGFGLYNSKTGDRVAEFEDGEDILVFNKQQKKKYRHVIDALISDAQGRSNIDSTLEGYYRGNDLGKDTLRIVKHVNEITISSNKKKQETSKNEVDLLEEISKFRKDFKTEFEGHRKKEDDKIEAWETKHFYYVKKGNLTKKYRKDE